MAETAKKLTSMESRSHFASGTIGKDELPSSNAELRVIKDELDFAIGDVNSSGLLSKGILDEMRRSHDRMDDNTKPSGRFNPAAGDPSPN